MKTICSNWNVNCEKKWKNWKGGIAETVSSGMAVRSYSHLHGRQSWFRSGSLPLLVGVSFCLLQMEVGKFQPEVSGKQDRKSTRLNSSHVSISYAVFCVKKNK